MKLLVSDERAKAMNVSRCGSPEAVANMCDLLADRDTMLAEIERLRGLCADGTIEGPKHP